MEAFVSASMPLDVHLAGPLEAAAGRPVYFENLRDLDEYVKTLPKAWERGQRTAWPNRPHLLVCHDFQGGYTESLHAQGYTFEHWQCTDIMVYFSHKRVSLPPPGWVRAAHFHGTRILGTLLFEWDESKLDLRCLLDGWEPTWRTKVRAELSTYFADELIRLAAAHGIDGFLVNVETSLALTAHSNPILHKLDSFHNAARLRRWIRYLRDKGQERLSTWHVVWYDSVTYPDGQLQWQDAMSLRNAPYFQAASLGFTNYTWSHPERCHVRPNPCLEHSAVVADTHAFPRSHVFIGVDVFGRNCLGGHDTYRALDMLQSETPFGFSAALFAPGWTWEHDAPPARSWQAWWDEDWAFWHRGPHAISHYFASRACPWHGQATLGYGFRTNFSLGAGSAWFVQGRNVYPHAWTDQGVCAPKPLLAWPAVAYVLDVEGRKENDPGIRTTLTHDDAWSGTTSLCLRTDTWIYVPLVALAPLPSDATQRKVQVRISVKGASVEPCVYIHDRLYSGTCEAQALPHGWTLYTSQVALPQEAHDYDIHMVLGVSGSVRVGQVDVAPASAYDETAPDATWSHGLLTWTDTVPWASGYEVYTIRDEPIWWGTVSTVRERHQAHLSASDPETVVQIQSVGAWPDEPVTLVMPS